MKPSNLRYIRKVLNPAVISSRHLPTNRKMRQSIATLRWERFLLSNHVLSHRKEAAK